MRVKFAERVFRCIEQEEMGFEICGPSKESVQELEAKTGVVLWTEQRIDRFAFRSELGVSPISRRNRKEAAFHHHMIHVFCMSARAEP